MIGEKRVSNWNYISLYILPFIVILSYYIAIILAETLTLKFCEYLMPQKFNLDIPLSYYYIWVPIVFIFFLIYTGAHKRMIPFWDVIKNIFCANFYSTIIAIFILYLIHEDLRLISRLYIIILFVMTFICLCFVRQILVYICNYLNIFKESVIVIGASKTAESLIKYFNTNNCFGVNIVGIVEYGITTPYLEKNYYIIKNVSNLKDYIRKIGIKTVIIAQPEINKQALVNLITDIQPVVKNILFIPNLSGTPIANLDIKRLYTEDVVLLNVRNNLAHKRNILIKRIFDFIVSLIICIPVIPIIIICAIWVKLDSKGPIFYNAKRIGKDGKEFTCYKFRSMYINGDELLKKYLAKNPEAQKEWDEFQKLHDFDPRVTKAGKIMRKTSLDELPQILNVLKGEMSLVGPRPYLPREIKMIGQYMDIITSTVPGITGYWQVNGRSDVTFEGRLKMDNWYIRNWSIWIDMVLLLKTIKAVFFSKGAV